MPDQNIPPPDSGQDPTFTALSSDEVIDRLKAAHPAFTVPEKPLAVGIRAALAMAHPEIHPYALRVALARWCGRPDYLKALIAGVPRYALDGTACGEVSEEHQAAALVRLERLAERRRPAPPVRLKVAVRTKPTRSRPPDSPPPSSAAPEPSPSAPSPPPTSTYSTTGGRARLSLKRSRS